MTHPALYDMTPEEREDFENDCASAWLDRKRDQDLEERLERRGYNLEELDKDNPYNQWIEP